MKITHALQQKVIGKYKDIIEHQMTIIEAQRHQIQKLENELTQLKAPQNVINKSSIHVIKQRFEVWMSR